MADRLPKFAKLGHETPSVRRLGLATRGNTHLTTDDVLYAIDNGINYLNWCAYPDGLSNAIRQLSSSQRKQIVVAMQFSARSADAANRELDSALYTLDTDYLDIITFYYVETENDWVTISAMNGALEPIRQSQMLGKVKLIGLTTHQRDLAVRRAQNRDLDLLMIRYNAAHRGAEGDIFSITDVVGIPVIAFTALRWGALLRPTSIDPLDWRPPTAQECYRFVLSNPSVAVGLMAPSDRKELEANLSLLRDWRSLTIDEMKMIRTHGDRVYQTAGVFE
ncbi:TPA: aldo/keto reductase [Candidatus Poribacteria bacterium]|nr:aldo/keto reductase [Candidatus Poribacteria bacterium]HIA65896.1 aldo/keto reductase [Candidatus Poribacteria bacterium]HIB89966.1 aldo/keto reductase [Candidatus Poribacteria bacterium]HIC02123.1 aldo/keto reductase [Candidatus Poribacteria bacterium]HIC17144.1 aldo/keto reductase [Candidatus Poribacteria bacterium]